VPCINLRNVVIRPRGHDNPVVRELLKHDVPPVRARHQQRHRWTSGKLQCDCQTGALRHAHVGKPHIEPVIPLDAEAVVGQKQPTLIDRSPPVLRVVFCLGPPARIPAAVNAANAAPAARPTHPLPTKNPDLCTYAPVPGSYSMINTSVSRRRTCPVPGPSWWGSVAARRRHLGHTQVHDQLAGNRSLRRVRPTHPPLALRTHWQHMVFVGIVTKASVIGASGTSARNAH
jgi:hypothetical protein